MGMKYHVRIVCDGEGTVHYYREIQDDTIDDTIECADHPGEATRDFVIEEKHITEE